MRSYTIIGITDAEPPQLSAEALSTIAAGKIFSGGRRHHELVRQLLPEDHIWIDIIPPMDDLFARYKAVDGEIIVFASGDPLFFGFANTVLRKDPEAAVRVLPAFNSLQLLAHRLLLPYHDLRCLSLVGRDWTALDAALIRREPLIGVLVDGKKTPNAVAHRLLTYNYKAYAMSVGERLGGPQERVRTFPLEEVLTATFEQPCCLILKAISELPARPYGIPDGAFALLNGRERMITKMPIRLLTLQALDLSSRHTLWDIGFCTGSVSIEARLQFPHLQVVAFEQRPEGALLMETNSQRFGAPGIDSRIGDFLLDTLEGVPRPDAVFIGGHGGRLAEIMQRIDTLIEEGGRVVLNSVTDESRTQFEGTAVRLGWQLLPSLHLTLNDYNPITILSADVHRSH